MRWFFYVKKKVETMVIGALEIQMYADIARLKADMDQAKSVVGSSMKSITDAVDLAKKAMMAFAGIASVDAFASMVRNNITAAASLGKLATQAGVTVEAMSGLVGVGKLSGTAAETVAASMNKMTKAMSSTTEEGKGAGAALRALGLNFDDFQKLSPDERMLAAAKAMEKFQDGSGKSAVAMALMGKSGAEMLPYMKDLAEVGQLNAKVTTEQAAMAKDFDLNLKKVTVSSEAWKKEISMGMLPALDDASIAFLGVMNSTGGLRDGIKKLSQDGTIDSYVRSAVTVLTYFADIIEYVVRAVKIMGEGIGAYIALIITQFNGLGAAIKLAMSGEFAAAGDALKTSFSQSKAIVTDYGKSIIDTFGAETMGKKFRDRMEDVKGLSAATAKAKAEANSLKPKLEDDFNQKVGTGAKAAIDPQIKIDYDAAISKLKSYADELKFINSELIKDIDSIHKRGVTSEYDYQNKKKDAAMQGIADQQAIAEQEIAIAKASKLPLLERQKAIEAFRKTLQDLNQAKRAIDAESIRQEYETNAKLGAAMDKRLEDMQHITKALVDEKKSLRQEREEFGLTEQQLNALRIARAEEMASALDRQAVTRDTIDLTGAESAELRKQADLIRENAKYRVENTGIKEIQSQWKAFYGDIERGLTDSLFRAFESGKGFFSTLWNGIKNLFKTTVLKLVVQGVAGAVGLGGTSASLAQQALGATGAAGGALGGASSLMSGVNAATGAFGASAMSTGMGVWGGLGELSSLGIGEALSTGFSAVTSGTLVGLSGGLGAIAGALGPIALGAVALYSLFGNKESASKSTGDLQRSYSASGAVTAESSRFGIGNGAQVIDGLYAQLNKLQQLLGAKGAVDFGYGAYSGNGNKNPMGAISAAGFNSGEVPTAELGLAASRAVLAALQASEMPAGIAKIINSIDPATSSAEQIKALELNAATYAQTIKNLSASFDSLPFANLKGMAFEAADALVTASGGLGNFNNNLKSYYDNFYSEEEKRVQTIKEINAATAGSGLDAATATRESFRALVSAQDVTTESGQKTYAALLAVSGSFASITPAAEKAAASITAISDTMKGLLKDRASLQADVLEASGKTREAEKARRLIVTAGYTELEIVAYDYNVALRDEIKTRQDATAALATSQAAALALAQAADQAALAESKAGAAERKGLQDQINSLTDTAAQALNRQRDALRESNQALFDQVQALTAIRKANEANAAAAASFSNNIASTIAKYNTPAQNNTAAYVGIANSLKASGLAAADYNSLADELQAATKDQIKEVAQKLFDGLGVGADVAKEHLRILVDSLADLKDAEARAAQTTANTTASAVLAQTAIESVAEAYKRLTEELKTNEQIAQERINLEGRLHAATDTAAQAAARARNAIDPLNRTLFDTASAAEAAKTAVTALKDAQTQVGTALTALVTYGQNLISSIKTTTEGINGLRGRATSEQLAAEKAFTQAVTVIFQQKQTAEAAYIAAQKTTVDAQKALVSAQQQVAQAVADQLSKVTAAQDKVKGAQANITSAYIAANDRVQQLQKQAADGLKTAAQSIGNFLDELAGKVPGQDPMGSITAQKGSFDELIKLASGGDSKAAESLPKAAQKLLDAAEMQLSTQAEFLSLQTQIRQGLFAAQSGISLSAAKLAPGYVDPTTLPEGTLPTAPVVARTELQQAIDALKSITDIVKASGASKVAEQNDLLAAYTTATKEVTTAQALYADMLAKAGAAGIGTAVFDTSAFDTAMAAASVAQATLTQDRAAESAALSVQLDAQRAYAAALVQATSFGPDVVKAVADSVAAVTTAVTSFGPDVVKTVADSVAAVTTAVTGINGVVTAVDPAAATLAKTVTELATAQTALTAANNNFLAIQAGKFIVDASIVEKYGALVMTLASQKNDLDAFGVSISGVASTLTAGSTLRLALQSFGLGVMGLSDLIGRVASSPVPTIVIPASVTNGLNTLGGGVSTAGVSLSGFGVTAGGADTALGTVNTGANTVAGSLASLGGGATTIADLFKTLGGAGGGIATLDIAFRGLTGTGGSIGKLQSEIDKFSTGSTGLGALIKTYQTAADALLTASADLSKIIGTLNTAGVTVPSVPTTVPTTPVVTSTLSADSLLLAYQTAASTLVTASAELAKITSGLTTAPVTAPVTGTGTGQNADMLTFLRFLTPMTLADPAIRANLASKFGMSVQELQIIGRGANIPGFAVGTNYVPYDMLAQVHKGETIIPAFDAAKFRNDGGGNSNNDELIKALIEEIKALRQDNNDGQRAIVGNTLTTAKLLGRAMPDGDALATRVAA